MFPIWEQHYGLTVDDQNFKPLATLVMGFPMANSHARQSSG